MTTANNLDKQTLDNYNKLRQEYDLSRSVNTVSPCLAPFNNIYFTTEGNAAPCWLLVGHMDKWSKDKSIDDIWNGEKFKTIRENLKNGDFSSQCRICKQKIESETWPLAIAYDGFTVKDRPTLLELELSNQCNLECVMCEGRLSSGIRKNRDKLPPLPQIYDETFLQQIREYIPQLEEIRFNGGEPFAQQIVYDICMIANEINPSLKINIATNGTVYNKRVREMMDKCNLHLNISIDSLQKQNYESIRINGNFDELMDNFQIFRKYSKDNNRNLCVMVNPMRSNWIEMPDFVRFATKNDVFLWYNTIHHPEHLSLWSLPSSELSHILETLRYQLEIIKLTLDTSNFRALGNWEKLQHLVNGQIDNWHKKQLSRESVEL